MKIESIHITKFAGISDREIAFSDGINIIEGDNESGKSTINEFIKFILYGISGKSEKRLIFGWTASGDKTVSGSMTVLCGKKRYRIERSLSENGKGGCRIIELAGNTVCRDNADPGELFLGVPADVYSQTAFLSQSGGGYVDGKDIGEGIENILFSADENINTQKVLKRLDEARIALLYKNKRGGKIFELKNELEELKMRLDKAADANSLIIAKEGSARDIGQKIEENGRKNEELEKNILYYETGMQKRQYDKLLEYRKELAEAKNQLESFADKYKYNGFIPDKAYFDALDSLETDMENTKRGIEAAEAEIRGAKIKGIDSDSSFDVSGESGGISGMTAELKDEIISSAAQNTTKRKSYIFVAVVFLILSAVVGVIAAAVMTLKGAEMAIMFGVGSLALLFFAVMSFFAVSKCKKANSDIFAKYGASDIKQLETALSKMIEDEKTRQRIGDFIYELEQKKAKLEAQYSEQNEKLRLKLAMWNMTDADGARKLYEDFTREKDEICRRQENLSAAYNSAADGFGGVDADELRQRLKNYTETVPLESLDINKIKRENDFLVKAQRALIEKKHEYEKQLAGLYASAEQPSRIADRITEVEMQLEELTKRHDAYILAYEKLADAGGRLKESIAPRLSGYAGKLLSELSGDKYSTLGVGKDLELQYLDNAGGETHDIEFMSAGTRDIAYISLRFALIKLLYRNELPPVTFDESFARLDDKRLFMMLEIIYGMTQSEGIQAMIYTCQKRDAEIMGKVASFEHIRIYNVKVQHIRSAAC